MRKDTLNYFAAIDTWLYLILTFCMFGFFRNLIILKYLRFDYSYFNTKVCLAMLIIYFAQIVLILLRQRKVFIISLIQAFFCLYVFRDFTFLPLSNLLTTLKNLLFPNLDYGWEYFISFALISLVFCLELIKTYLLYALTDEPPKNKTKNAF